jgi:hypothetical protein
MSHLIQHHHQPITSSLIVRESTPPIPPRTHPCQSILVKSDQHESIQVSFRLNDLPSPDHEWQLLENIGDGTYGEVFHVS